MSKQFHPENFPILIGEREKGMVAHQKKSFLVVVETPSFIENN